MRVGVLELLVDSVSRSWVDVLYGSLFKKYYASIMPQAVSVWCRQLGHEVFYATFHGQRDPKRLLPDDLDVVFISTYTQASALAYALAKLYRREKTLTVIGGPHARSFPHDCTRFFDIVVVDCDKALIDSILRFDHPKSTIVSSPAPLRELPSVEERMPEIRTSAFSAGRIIPLTTVPLLTSVGCPYSCDFCVDWNKPYFLLSQAQLEADLRYISRNLPRVLVAYHDPNFGVKFERVIAALNAIEPRRRNRYIMEASLSILREGVLPQLKATNCIYVAPGIESWSSYSNKTAAKHAVGDEKLAGVVDHFRRLWNYIPGLQANFIFGSDMDAGQEPVDLTKRFITALPQVWPTINIPTPFGGTPLYDQYLRQGRILRRMPFSFYYTPYLVTTLKNYEPADYYGKLIDIFEAVRTRSRPGDGVHRGDIVWRVTKLVSAMRALAMREDVAILRMLRGMLESDRSFRRFHEGRPEPLPEFYHSQFEKRLGRYASLISRGDRTPELAASSSSIVGHELLRVAAMTPPARN